MIILIIIFAIISLFLIILSGIIFACDGLPGVGGTIKESIAVFVLGLFFFVFSGLAMRKHTKNISYEEGYKAGQIDAANGKQKYVLTTQPSEWKLKEGTK